MSYLSKTILEKYIFIYLRFAIIDEGMCMILIKSVANQKENYACNKNMKQVIYTMGYIGKYL